MRARREGKGKGHRAAVETRPRLGSRTWRDRYADSTSRALYWRTLIDRVRSLPGVAEAIPSRVTPLEYGLTGWAHFTLDDGRVIAGGNYEADAEPATVDYFRVTGMRPIEGRLFRPDEERENSNVAVLSQGIASELWPGQDPVGRRFRVDPRDTWRTVIGVVANVGAIGPDAASRRPKMYWPEDTTILLARPRELLVRVRPGTNIATVSREIVAAARSLDPSGVAPDVESESSEIAFALASPRFSTTVLGAFAVLAMLMAALGLYAVIAYAVGQRTHEVGIRMALGARGADVVRPVIGEGLRLALLGVAVGLAGAFMTTKLLSVLLTDVSPHDPIVFALIPAVVVGVAIVACWVPARRAATVDPMAALRHE